MNVQNNDASESALTSIEVALKVTLQSLIDELHGSAGTIAIQDPVRIDQVERELRRVVLGIVQIERERIELRIAGAL